MCRAHGHLIDADFEEYSPDTLRAWKNAAERRAAESLRFRVKDEYPDGSTLLQLGSRNIFHATWKAITRKKWSFLLVEPEIGSVETLKDYVASVNPASDADAFIVVESQGDARRFNSVSLQLSQTGHLLLEIAVRSRVPPTDPNDVGSDFKIGSDGDILIECGDVAMVKGVDAAKQLIMLTLGTPKGRLPWAVEAGSYASAYYSKYRDNLMLLSRLMKIELIRLSLIPVSDGIAGRDPMPSLQFVKRFLNVFISSADLSNRMLIVFVGLEWGNGEYWSGNVPVYIPENGDYSGDEQRIGEADSK